MASKKDKASAKAADPAENEAQFLSLLAAQKHDNGDAILVPTSHTMQRFIVARKFDVKAAVEQYVGAQKWRRDFKLEGITGPDPNEHIFTALCPHRNHKYAKDGCPVYVEKLGLMPVMKLLKYVDPPTILRRQVRQMEIAATRMAKSSARMGKIVSQHYYIGDLAGLKFPPKIALKIFGDATSLEEGCALMSLSISLAFDRPVKNSIDTLHRESVTTPRPAARSSW
eukprot:m.392274 g.392274  ORF g.392274 m.392274 type:complete len:226 (-) comp56348_c0_seq30:1824-2501(-)